MGDGTQEHHTMSNYSVHQYLEPISTFVLQLVKPLYNMTSFPSVDGILKSDK